MKQNKIIGERVIIESGTGVIWSSKFGTISTNGIYHAIRVGDTIYDNLNPTGIKYGEWLYDLGISEQPKMFNIYFKSI